MLVEIRDEILDVHCGNPMLRAMAFPKNLLNPNEEVAVDLNPHWLYFFEPVVTVIGLVILALFVQFQLDGSVEDTLVTVLVIGVIAAAVWAGIRYLKWSTTSFVVTDDRVIFRHGIFAKAGVQIPLERINNVNFHQTFIERMVGAGDLLIESGGESGQSRFTDVRHPDQIQKLIHAQIDLNEEGGRRQPAPPGQSDLPPPPPPAAVDVAGQLERLEGLLQRGSITRAEYDAQKAKLLAS
jgi:membrane protein YdbS with pleckstrin-like domain